MTRAGSSVPCASGVAHGSIDSVLLCEGVICVDPEMSSDSVFSRNIFARHFAIIEIASFDVPEHSERDHAQEKDSGGFR